MRRLSAFFLGLLFALALATDQAGAGIGTPALLGASNQASSLTNVVTTGADCPVGSIILLATAYTTIADTLSSVTDSASPHNTYTVFDNTTETGVGQGLAWAVVVHDLPSGGTITATFGGSVTTEAKAVCTSVLATTAPLDQSNHTSIGLSATAATSVATNTLAQPAELVIGATSTATSAAGAACVTSGNTLLAGAVNTTPSIILCYKVTAATTAVSHAPSWTTAANYVNDVISLKSAPVVGHSNLLMGFGQ